MSVKILSTVETLCAINPQQIEVRELKGYSWPTCCKQPRLVDSCVLSSTVVVDDEFVDRCCFLEIPKFPYNTMWDMDEREHPCRNPARFVQSFRYNTGLWQTDRWTDRRTHNDNKYRASIASCVKRVAGYPHCVPETFTFLFFNDCVKN